jgi:hypothetical protein
LNGRPAGSFRIELQYLPGDETVVMKAAGDLRGAAGEAKGVRWSRCGGSEDGITVNGRAKQMRPRCRWRDRRGKTLREAADALVVKTGDQDKGPGRI